MEIHENNDVEGFIYCPREQILLKAKQAELSVKSYHRENILEYCQNMLILNMSAKRNMVEGNYDTSLNHHWRFLLLYRNNLHQIRRSKTVPISLKSRLEEKATSSLLAVEWLRKKHYQRHFINHLRHKRDRLRWKTEQDGMHEQLFPKTEDALKKYKSLHRIKSVAGRTLIPQGFQAGYHLLLMLQEIARKTNVNIPCTVGTAIRNVYLSSQVINLFTGVIQRNDFNRVKTTGIFAATSKDSLLVITHLLIPEQNSDSRYCLTAVTKDFEEFIESNNLFVVGYAYSAVKGDANLSWMECHELCELRQRVKEAFALVVCNSRQQVRYFYLTEAGFNLISNCKETDVHIHNIDEPKYKEPAHVNLTDKYDIKIQDFRQSPQKMPTLQKKLSFKLPKATKC